MCFGHDIASRLRQSRCPPFLIDALLTRSRGKTAVIASRLHQSKWRGLILRQVSLPAVSRDALLTRYRVKSASREKAETNNRRRLGAITSGLRQTFGPIFSIGSILTRFRVKIASTQKAVPKTGRNSTRFNLYIYLYI